MNHKCIIICESIYNDNTLKLAKAMSQTLGCSCITTDEALALNLAEYETIGLGSGIYFGKHHPRLFEVVEKLNSVHQKFFIFSSRGNPFLGKYHQPLKEALRGKGKTIIGEFSVQGYDETGPWVIIGGGHRGKPDEKDLKKAISKSELDCTLCRLCVINCKQRAISLHYTWCDAIKVAQRHGKRTSLC